MRKRMLVRACWSRLILSGSPASARLSASRISAIASRASSSTVSDPLLSAFSGRPKPSRAIHSVQTLWLAVYGASVDRAHPDPGQGLGKALVVRELRRLTGERHIDSGL